MRKSFSKIALAVTLGFALAFTFSCSSDDGDDSKPSGNVGLSSSSIVLSSSSSSGGDLSSSVSSSSEERARLKRIAPPLA